MGWNLIVWEFGSMMLLYHNDIAPKGDLNSNNGKFIVEALRSGVELNTLDHFLNVDDLVILRPVFPDSTTLKDKKESLLLAFRQIGKDYDFNFDVNTTEKIVCSELAYVCFPQFEWPTEKLVGRHTISPDNVITHLWDSKELELISFYHDGVKCKDREKLKILKKLVLENN